MITPYHSRSTRRDRRGTPLLALVVAAFGLGGCSFGMPSMLPEGDELATGSIKPADTSLAPGLAPEDWRRAKAALAVALDLQGNGQPVKWDNPETKLRGEISPAGQPFVEKDDVCRAFLATVTIADGRTSVHDGRACKIGAEEWEIRSVQHSRPR